MRVIGLRIYGDIRKYGIIAAALFIYIGVVHLVKIKVCPVLNLLGIPCPMCGMTRAFTLLFSGHWKEAWQMHPFSYIIIITVLVIAVLRYLFGIRAAWIKELISSEIVLLIVFYIYRMMMYFPDQEPMIYNANNVLVKLEQFIGQLVR